MAKIGQNRWFSAKWISHDFALSKNKQNTHNRVWTRWSVCRIIFQFRPYGRLVIRVKKPNDIRKIFAHIYLRHLLTKLKNERRHNRQIPRAVQNCSRNSCVGTTTPRRTQEGFSGFWQTRDGISCFFLRISYVAAVGDGHFNDVNGFSNRPPHHRQSVPLVLGERSKKSRPWTVCTCSSFCFRGHLGG